MLKKNCRIFLIPKIFVRSFRVIYPSITWIKFLKVVSSQLDNYTVTIRFAFRLYDDFEKN